MNTEPDILDPITELLGTGIGKAGSVLNTMLSSHIRLSAPSVKLIPVADLAAELNLPEHERLSAVEMGYAGGLEGTVELIFATEEAGKLVDCITGMEGIPENDFDSIRSGTLCEVGNIVINAVMGTLSNSLHIALKYSVPVYFEGDIAILTQGAIFGQGGVILLVRARFQVEKLDVEGDIAIFFTLESFDKLKTAVAAYCAA